MDDGQSQKFKKHSPRSEVKRLRLTVDERKQLDDFLDHRNLQFSDFANSLLRKAVSAEFHLVVPIDDDSGAVMPVMPSKEKRVHREPPKVDPQLLLELGRIGTNLNQAAKALNLIKNDRDRDLDISQHFSFLECLQVLKLIQEDIHAVIGELPKHTMSEKAKAKARERVIKAVERKKPKEVGGVH